MSKVRTVLGDIPSSSLGVTLTHEHVLIDLRFICDLMAPSEASLRGLMNRPVSMEMSTLLRRGVRKFNYDDALLSDVELAARELQEFRAFGGNSLVDQSLPGIGRDPIGLSAISRISGVNIVCSTGWYVVGSHPPYVKAKSSDELARMMVDDLEVGIGDSSVKAGVIGECASSYPIPFHEEEKKVFVAACRAQKQVGSAFSCHPAFVDPVKRIYTGDAAFAYVDIIEAEGANIEKFFLSHSDIVCNPGFFRNAAGLAARLLDRGLTLNFDTFGQDHYDDFIFMGARHPSDSERMMLIVDLCERGYEKQIMLSQDVCWKHMLKRYGGAGYSHVLEHIVPTLRYHGVKQSQISTMLVDNPQRMLSF